MRKPVLYEQGIHSQIILALCSDSLILFSLGPMLLLFLRRSIAYLMDCLLVRFFVRPTAAFILIVITHRIVGELGRLGEFSLLVVTIGIGWWYVIGSHAGWGCTLGKAMCGLHVAALDGSIPPPLRNAFLRAVPMLIIGNLDLVVSMFGPESWRADIFSREGWHANIWQILILLGVCLDIAGALLTGGRRSLHDMIGRTFVTREVRPMRAMSDEEATRFNRTLMDFDELFPDDPKGPRDAPFTTDPVLHNVAGGVKPGGRLIRFSIILLVVAGILLMLNKLGLVAQQSAGPWVPLSTPQKQINPLEGDDFTKLQQWDQTRLAVPDLSPLPTLPPNTAKPSAESQGSPKPSASPASK